MKGKINAAGHLSIERRGKFKAQFCRHSENESYCGDWCPLFVERVRKDMDWEKYLVVLHCSYSGVSHEIVEDLRKEEV